MKRSRKRELGPAHDRVPASSLSLPVVLECYRVEAIWSELVSTQKWEFWLYTPALEWFEELCLSDDYVGVRLILWKVYRSVERASPPLTGEE